MQAYFYFIPKTKIVSTHLADTILFYLNFNSNSLLPLSNSLKIFL
jgi:hypothetical protein